MEISALCAVVATLTVLPNRSQFFQYESVHLSCGNHGNSSRWTVKRSTSLNNREGSDQNWNGTNESNWYTQSIYWFDSGEYWCESPAGGRCSNTIIINVTEGSVILESPVVPVTEGEALTLLCRNRTASSSSLNTDFYKDGRLIRSNTTPTMTIHNVLKSDEGLYKCKISGAGESVESRLSVRETRHPEPPMSSLTNIILPVVGVCFILASVMLLCLWRNKGNSDPDVSYTDVIITQEVPPHRVTDSDLSTIYSAVKPGSA